MHLTSKIAIVPLVLLSIGYVLAEPSTDVQRYRSASNSKVEFDIHENKDPIFPYTLRRQGIDHGRVTFAIYVNQFGELADYLLLEATHVEFAAAVERVLPDWQYSVPLLNGETASIASTITVTFKRGAGILYKTSGFADISYPYEKASDEKYSFRTFSPKELDSIPIPIFVEKPSFHIELLEERELINAVFEFYIDTGGNVRIPTLREADEEIDERLLIIAQEALLQWKFDPPRKNDRPVVARAAQPFRFKKKDKTGLVE